MTTATRVFSRAIHVRKSDTGCYEFATTRDDFFQDVISYHGKSFAWEIVEPLTGWGKYTHAIRVMQGDQAIYYFAH